MAAMEVIAWLLSRSQLKGWDGGGLIMEAFPWDRSGQKRPSYSKNGALCKSSLSILCEKGGCTDDVFYQLLRRNLTPVNVTETAHIFSQVSFFFNRNAPGSRGKITDVSFKAEARAIGVLVNDRFIKL